VTSNCLWYALDTCEEIGGGLVIVASTHWPIPHVQHISHDRVITQYVPPHDLKEPWHSLFGFEGVVEVVDKGAAKRKRMSALGMFLGTIILLVSGGLWMAHRGIKYLRSQTWTGYQP